MGRESFQSVLAEKLDWKESVSTIMESEQGEGG